MIREMRIKDIQHVFALLRESDLFDAEIDHADKFKRKLGVDRDLMLVAEENAMIVGFVMVSYDYIVPLFWHFCVSKQYRKQGHGTALLAELKLRLRARGAREDDMVYGLVRHQNDYMLRFANRHGFTIDGSVIVIKTSV